MKIKLNLKIDIATYCLPGVVVHVVSSDRTISQTFFQHRYEVIKFFTVYGE